jgi:hypothetical protein
MSPGTGAVRGTPSRSSIAQARSAACAAGVRVAGGMKRNRQPFQCSGLLVEILASFRGPST